MLLAPCASPAAFSWPLRNQPARPLFTLPVQLSVHIYDQGTIAGTTGLSYLAALITPSQQWAPARVTPPTNVIIQLTSTAQDGGATVGLCRYNVPSDCLPGRTAVPSYLPSDRCNMNGSCEAVFGEIGACYDCMG